MTPFSIPMADVTVDEKAFAELCRKYKTNYFIDNCEGLVPLLDLIKAYERARTPAGVEGLEEALTGASHDCEAGTLLYLHDAIALIRQHYGSATPLPATVSLEKCAIACGKELSRQKCYVDHAYGGEIYKITKAVLDAAGVAYVD